MTSARRGFDFVPAMACAAAGILLFQFWGNATHGYIATNSLFYWWVFQWVNRDSETQHGWLILGLSLFLLWRNLGRERPAGRMPRAALAAMLTALVVHAAGFIAQQPRVSILALLVYIWGLCALAGGRRWGRASAFPITFMVFAIPVNALDTVGFWLQMAVVKSGAHVAHLLGIGVIRNGTQLFAPDGRYQYDVVAACSGIRSMMALTALSLFIGYLWFRPAWLRAAMLLLSLPLVYFGNVLRISTIVIAAQWGGQSWGDRVHDVMGFGVFIVVIVGVIAIAEAVGKRKPGWLVGDPPHAGSSLPDPMVKVGARLAAGAVVLLAIVDGLFLSYRASRPYDERPGVILAKDGANPIELPTYLGASWMGRRVDPDAVERAILPPDTGFSRKYYVDLDDPGRHVLLSIVLSGRDRTSIHRPELCVVGQGWTIERTSRHHFDYPARGDAGFEATVLSVRHEVIGPHGRASLPNIIVYWFVGDDRIEASQLKRILYDAWSRLAHGRAPRWAYVYLQTGTEDGEAAGIGRIQDILNLALPSFQPPYPAGNVNEKPL
jgi:exosortase